MDDSAEVPEVLQLFLQQPSVANNSSTAVFKLLTTSNAMRAAIDGTLTGRLSLAYSNWNPTEQSYYSATISKRKQGKESLLAWLRQYCHLLRSLHIQHVVFDFGDLLAAALRDAAASPKGLHLQSYDSDWDDSNSLAVLKALPAHSLTHLRICLTEPMPEDNGDLDQIPIHSEEDVYAMEDFIHQMPMQHMQYIRTRHDNLSSLTLRGYETLVEDSPVMASLSNLTSLTKLSIQDVLPNSSSLRHLPTQLKELEVDGMRTRRENQPFAFGHLTALTRLHMSTVAGHWMGREWICVGSRDMLPPNLVSLCAKAYKKGKKT